MAVPNAAWTDLWEAAVTGIPYDPSWGIVKFWQAHYRELGSPLGPERKAVDGSTYQAFAGGIVKWSDHASIV